MPSGTYILLKSFVHRLQQEKCSLCKTRVVFRAVKHLHFLPLCSWSVEWFETKSRWKQKRRYFVRQFSFGRISHIQCIVWLHPTVFSRNLGLLGTPVFRIFEKGTSCKLLIFTCACSTIKTTVPHCKGRLYESDHSSVRQKGVEHKGINALITTESHLFQWSSSV